ncbi:MAG: alpha-amylase [Lachnospiraceae bacterium]|nr:alpha-amylase [Lachnospiraceae bacterium]
MEKITYLRPGVHFVEDKVHITVENYQREPLFLILYDKDKKTEEIPFNMNDHIGAMYFMVLDKAKIKGKLYKIRCGRNVYTDAYAVRVTGTEKWGNHRSLGCFDRTEIDWEGDRTLCTPFSEMVLYHLHVRGFTMHRSSGVKHRGTFEGVEEKIPYIKSLGINVVELMPCYDFEEVMNERIPKNISETSANAAKEHQKYNYWGFAPGNYMTPKNAYAATGDGTVSFCNMVKAMHKEGISVIVDFFFDGSTKLQFILDVLRRWVIDYHVDGFRVVGPAIPAAELAADAYLADTKLLFDAPPDNYGIHTGSATRHLAVINHTFMYDHRKFLKSDDDMLGKFVKEQLSSPDNYAEINFMADYSGFTLNDVVSYDEKHNIDNGEHNMDGNNYNYSWNCGVEGTTRKRYIIQLRRKQLRNAFTFLFLAQGVPEILAGDEFCNSQQGNNNAYCQDNMISWLNWNDYVKNRDIFNFVKEMIEFRKKHKIFKGGISDRGMSYRAGDYPEVSFHGEQAWAPRYDNFYRHIGIMYNGGSADKKSKNKNEVFFLAYNMHWQNHRFALPKAPAGMVWQRLMTTASGFVEDKSEVPSKDFLVEARSIRMLVAVPKKTDKEKVAAKKEK